MVSVLSRLVAGVRGPRQPILGSESICDGGLNALWCLRQADIQKGQKYLVYGASGAIGTAAVQLAKHFGTDVTAVRSTKNLELMGTLGAERAIDHTKEDFTQNSEKYDVILEPACERE